MTREPLDRLLETVSDEDLEALRDAILREEGRRRAHARLVVKAPYPPLTDEKHGEVAVTRWSRLLAWLAKDAGIAPAVGKRGVSIAIEYAGEPPDDPRRAGILLQDALVEAGLLLGRTPEWMDATTLDVAAGDADAICVELWEKPVQPLWE